MELFYQEYAGYDVDTVITTRELTKMIKSAHISPDTLSDMKVTGQCRMEQEQV